MKKVLIVFAVGLIISLATAVTLAFAPNKTAKPSDYNVGITYEQALSAKKPFVTLFYVDWCGYCAKFMPKFKTLQQLYVGEYNFVMINAEDPKYSKLVKKVRLGGYPTVIILDPAVDNQIVLSNTIYGDLGALREELDRYLNVRSKMIIK